MKKFAVAATLAAALMCSAAPQAAELEVTHWWTSGGESAAVAEFARLFDATGNKWVDSALAGSGTGANPVIISRILGGNPMGATQMNTGRDAEELIKAGLMTDLTPIAQEDGWADFFADPKLLDACTYDGKIYCVPINIHSWHWLWLSDKAYKDAGLTTPKDWNEYVASFPALREKGIIPFGLAAGWPLNGIPGVLLADVGGPELYLKINQDHDAEAVRSPEFRKVAEAWAAVRDVVDPAEVVPQFADVANQLIAGEAAGNIHGDWIQGEFALAGAVPGTDYECLPGLGLSNRIEGGGDAFYFPKLPEGTAQDVLDAQVTLAKLLVSPEAQVAFNLKKGSMPIRTDIDMSSANDCMKKAIEILKGPDGLLPGGETLNSSDTQQQLDDLNQEFFADKSYPIDDYIEAYAQIIDAAD
ncbi:ABC transporter substrate-binding protein [Devosia neptuniae]|jgi:glucose/mannose transport system substrate-binding protein|uniref:Probable sugar-binding periplasmic protein n=1 Tax=Devosia neptuniae TaxID=191302 RepID=A0ABY6CC21_9HYPH|nr:ABC transporter substrate-binding protein [Devosia neptuniae]UXN69685.1 ABC transporter substrate-binding protein [Devosia neptuniae]